MQHGCGARVLGIEWIIRLAWMVWPEIETMDAPANWAIPVGYIVRFVWVMIVFAVYFAFCALALQLVQRITRSQNKTNGEGR